MNVGQALRGLRRSRPRIGPAIEAVSGNTPISEYLNLDEIPKSLSVEFRNDYDIGHILKVVSSKIYHDAQTAGQIETKISMLLVRRADARSLNERADLDREIEYLKGRIIEYRNPERLKGYLDKANQLLDRYRSTPRPNHEFDIMKGIKRSYRPDENDLIRIGIILQFVELSSFFIKIDCICTGYTRRDIEHRCECCDQEIGDISPSEDFRIVCDSCGAENSAIRTNYDGETEMAHTNSSHKHRGYDDISNFKKALYRYLGIIKPKVDVAKLLVTLDEYFKSLGLPCGEIIKTAPLNVRGHRPGTSISMMIDALKSTGYTSCYEDVNYITNQYWGWELPVLPPGLESIILNDYRKTQAAWNHIPDTEKGRKSSIAAQYRLFKHLQLRGHICYVTDFKMPQPDSIQAYEKLWRRMCEDCHDDDIYFMPT